MGIPFITMDAHNIVNDNVAQGCGYPNRDQIVEISLEGPAVSFETNVEAPLVSLEAQIVALQEGSGTPSPSNVRPISGFSGATIVRCGVNLWDEKWELGYYSSTGEKVSTTNQLRTVNKIMAKPSTAYYFKIPVSNYNAFAVIEYDEKGEFLRRVTPSSYSGDGAIYTTSSDCHYFNINIGSSYGNVYLNNISINYPSSDTDYHAYNGQTVTVNFGQTVYGGRLNVTTGELTITHGYIDSYDGESINEPWISSIDEYVSGEAPTTGAEVVYPLAEPITVQLSPAEVNTIITIIGMNNISANTGDVKLTFIRVNK